MGPSVTIPPAVGNTPMVALSGLTTRGSVSIKAEYMNPFGSVKDRTALYLAEWAVEQGGSDVRMVESTSGNLGYAVARLHRSTTRPLLVMDASLPIERIRHVEEGGADVQLVSEPREGMDLRQTRIAVAAELGAEDGSVWLNQYGNEAGVAAHRETTGPEIWAETCGKLDAVVASTGSGGTVCGLGAFFQAVPDRPRVIAVEPLGSTIFGGTDGPYLPLGAGMRGPTELVGRHGWVIDLYAQVPDRLAARWVLDLGARYDVLFGLTTGAAAAVGAAYAEEHDARVVVIAPDLHLGFDAELAALAEADPEDPITIAPRSSVAW